MKKTKLWLIFFLVVIFNGMMLPEVIPQVQSEHPVPPEPIYDFWTYYAPTGIVEPQQLPFTFKSERRGGYLKHWRGVRVECDWNLYYSNLQSADESIKVKIYRGVVFTPSQVTVYPSVIQPEDERPGERFNCGAIGSVEDILDILNLPNLVLVGLPPNTDHVKIIFPTPFNSEFIKKREFWKTEFGRKFYYIPIIPLPKMANIGWLTQALSRALSQTSGKYSVVGFPLKDFFGSTNNILNTYKNDNAFSLTAKYNEENELSIEFKLLDNPIAGYNFGFHLKEELPLCLDVVPAYAALQRSSRDDLTKQLSKNIDEGKAGIYGIYPAYLANAKIQAYDENDNLIGEKSIYMVIGVPWIKSNYRYRPPESEGWDVNRKVYIENKLGTQIKDVFYVEQLQDGRFSIPSVISTNTLSSDSYEVASIILYLLMRGETFKLCEAGDITIRRDCQNNEKEIPLSEFLQWVPNLDVKFFFYKYGGVVAKQKQQTPAEQIQQQLGYGYYSKCIKNNTVRKDVDGTPFQGGKKGAVEFTAYAKNIGSAPITCNTNCYYECVSDICVDNKIGYVPDLARDEEKKLVESCNKQDQVKKFRVEFSVDQQKVNNLKGHFGQILNLANDDVPLEVAILERKGCEEEGKPYVIPDTLCVLFVAKSNQIDISTLPLGPKKLAKVRIGEAQAFFLNPNPAQNPKTITPKK